MASSEKLLDDICRKNARIRFAEACKAAELIGFSQKSVRGSHHVYKRDGEIIMLNFQKRNDGKIPSYQMDQLAAMIEKYREQK
jgi:predicted RNA binding protein YcfA (HicA-like mRNA interferase family)